MIHVLFVKNNEWAGRVRIPLEDPPGAIKRGEEVYLYDGYDEDYEMHVYINVEIVYEVL